MSPLPRPVRLALIYISVGLSLLVAGFGISRAISSGKILGSVTVLDVSLRGLTPEEATVELETLQSQLEAEPASFLVSGNTVSILAPQAGFDVDAEAIVTVAMEHGRTGNLSTQFREWLGSLGRTVPFDLESSLDPELVQTILEDWSSTYIGDPSFEGAVIVEDGAITAQYPKTGTKIDPERAPGLMLAQFSTTQRTPTELPIVVAQPVLTDRDVDRAMAEARLLVSSPIILTSGDLTVEFTPSQLLSALRSTITPTNPPTLELSFDEEVVAGILAVYQNEIEQAPVDARYVVDGYDVTIEEGRNGSLIDPAQTVAALKLAASTSSRKGTLPLQEGAEPEVTTADLETLGVTHLVSSFTTYHDCCQNRVINIHLMADAIDGVIVEPGASFEVNHFIGERTTEAGYLEDGTIEQGEIIETVGGGVSQFATTFYNAVFWGGYQDVSHKPHSFYFSRYPEGIEATISWPAPILEFRNDSGAAILIKTEYTDTSLTVKFFGANDGRVLVGSHRSGNTEIAIPREGGANARKVSANRSDRYSPTEPTTRYRANPEVLPGEPKRVQSPAGGWSITVARTIEQAGTSTTQEWVVRYLAKPEIIEVNPCEMPDSQTTCPTTTTAPPPTTVPPTTEAN